MENNQNVEQQLNQYRYIKEQRDMFQGQFEIINASLGNLFTTKLTLDNLKEGVNENDEILVPIGGLTSIRAIIKDTKKVLVYVKNDTIVEKTTEEAIEFISKLIDQHNTQLKFLQERIYNLDLNIQSMNQMLQSSMSQQ
ncbi:MAG: prefoldin subunit alpha [Candidatus Lokiarchaeota archaeon]|jgi:prefoldin alpha subunit|nr:prefoldin subunit alpha [Candidatus Lokiarchaeota archaeon]